MAYINTAKIRLQNCAHVGTRCFQHIYYLFILPIYYGIVVFLHILYYVLFSVLNHKGTRLFLVVFTFVVQILCHNIRNGVTQEEVDKNVKSLKRLGVKPKVDSSAVSKEWMSGLAASGQLGDVKVPVDAKQSNVYRLPPRISSFSDSLKDRVCFMEI